MNNFLLKTAFKGMFWQAVIFALFLFVPAQTLNWWRGWIFVAVVAISTAATVLIIFPGREELLRERMKPLVQKGQPKADKVLVLLFLSSYMAVITFIPLDVFHWHLMPLVNPYIAAAGLAVFIAGWTIISLCFKDNAFTAPVVKHQIERQQYVVDTGVYGIVRHPMYAGFIFFAIGTTLWLQSYAATIACIVPILFLAFRILIEEDFLKRELEGYEAYTKRIRYRMIPYIW